MALPFLSIRVLYSFVGSFDKSIGQLSGSIVYRIFFAVLMELLAALTLDAVGLITAYQQKAGTQKPVAEYTSVGGTELRGV